MSPSGNYNILLKESSACRNLKITLRLFHGEIKISLLRYSCKTKTTGLVCDTCGMIESDVTVQLLNDCALRVSDGIPVCLF